MDLVDTLHWAFRQNFHADQMNAAVHCAPVRYSPLTFRLAEQIKDYAEKNGDDLHPDVFSVIIDKGHYREDPGR